MTFMKMGSNHQTIGGYWRYILYFQTIDSDRINRFRISMTHWQPIGHQGILLKIMEVTFEVKMATSIRHIDLDQWVSMFFSPRQIDE